MDKVPNTEAIARSVVERSGAKAATSPDKLSAQQRAAQIREKGKERPRAALESMRTTIKPVDTDRIAAMEDKFGTKRKPDGTKDITPGTPEAKRRDDVKAAAEKANKYLAEGFDKLDPVAQKEVIQSVKDTLEKASPELRAAFDGMPQDEVEKNIAEMLKDPKFAEKVKTALDRVTDPSRTLSREDFNRLTEEYKKKQQLVEQKQAEETRFNNEYNDIKKKLEDFDPSRARDRNSKFRKMQGDKNALAGDVLSKDLVLQDLQARRDGYLQAMAQGKMTDIAAYNRTMESVKREIASAAKEKAEAQSKLDEVNRLEQEKENLELQLKATEQQRKQAEAEKKRLEADRDAAQGEMKAAENHQAGAEQKLVKDVQGVFAESALEYVEEKIGEHEKYEQELLDKEIAEAATESERIMLEAVKTRYDKSKPGWLRRNKYKRGQINQDFKVLVDPNIGPEGLMEQILREGGLSTDEVDALLANPDYVSRMQPRLVEQLIKRKIKVGGMKEWEAEHILDNEWGSDILKKALEGNKQRARDMGALLGDGSVDPDFIHKSKKGMALATLLAILFPVGLAVGAVKETWKSTVGS